MFDVRGLISTFVSQIDGPIFGGSPNHVTICLVSHFVHGSRPFDYENTSVTGEVNSAKKM